MRENIIVDLKKILFSMLSIVSILTAANIAQADVVSQAPLNLVIGVAPNIIFTLDESGSMSWSHVPDYDTEAYDDLIGAKGTSINNAATNTRRYRAANTNSIYYNPHVIYNIPPAFSNNGDELELVTSFSKAPINGFNLSKGSADNVDLTGNYKVVLEHRIPIGDVVYTKHPDADFSCTLKDFSSNGTKKCSVGVIDFTVKRINKSQCSASAILKSSTKVATCSLSDNTAVASISSTGVPAYYYEFDQSLTGCAGKKNTRDAGGENCYRLKYVDENSAYDEKGKALSYLDGTVVDGRRNFAIWYSFYKTRALATLSAASIAFYDLSSNIRFTWQNLGTCMVFDGSDSTHCNNNRLQAYSPNHRGQFYSWLRDIYFNVGTPLPAAMIRAGEFNKTDMPWRMYPQDSAVGVGNTRNTVENTLACRPSYHVMMTDGMWNTRQTYTNKKTIGWNGAVSWAGSYDGKEVAYPSSNTDDSMSAPYGDNTKKTLADIAMHYWKTDLSPLPDKVPPFMFDKTAGNDDPRNNPATWQHMSNFIMGLGLTSALNSSGIPWEGQTHTGVGYQNLKSGALKWPAAGLKVAKGTEANGEALEANVYDLWHASINSRGEFYSVESPDDIVKAFKDIMSRIAERQSTAALPAISAAVESDESDLNSIEKLASFFYRSSFDSTDWSGDLEKIKSYITYPNNKRTEITETVWKASNKLPKNNERKIYMAGSGLNKLQEFNASNVDKAPYILKNMLNKEPSEGVLDNSWKERLNYIRGDRTLEGSAFRERSSVLGDFLGSGPILVSGARYLEGFANKIEGSNHDKYTAFVASKKNRRAQVYIGGNAGMLHAFDARDGVERFAFVPTAVFPNLNRLTDPKYPHHFYVDGTPIVADVYDGNTWRTILVGTLGAGGKGLFALDITNPDDIKLLWEIGPENSDFSDIGYSIPKPTIARLHNGKWAVVTGNGYGGKGFDNGKASLYVIDAIDGSRIKSLEVTGAVKDNNLVVPNGLSTPKLVDFDADGVADYAYAGDLQGNIWRFDLLGDTQGTGINDKSIYGSKNSGITKFKVSYAGQPMFTAKAENGGLQSITSPPTVVRHPDRVGYLIVFGTGKYFASTDKAGITNYAQSVYGIWDKNTKAESTLDALSINRGNLQKQEFLESVIGTNKIAGVDRDSRTLSQETVNWDNQMGWRLDLSLGNGYTGEMVVNDMTTAGTTLLFSTLVPNDDPCAHGAGNWLYAINPAIGGRTERHVFDTRNLVDDPDIQVLSGIKFGDQGGVPLNFPPGGLEVPSSKGAEGINISEMTGRQTWRVVPAL